MANKTNKPSKIDTLRPWLALIVILIVLEFGFRLHFFGLPGVVQPWHYTHTSAVESDLMLPDSELGWRMKPNHSTWVKGALLSTNSKGFRDDEWISGHDCRIGILGRSVSAGIGVAQEDIWPQIFERRLQKHGIQAQVYNASVSGYDHPQVVKNYDKSVAPLHPQVVVLPFYLSEWNLPYKTEVNPLPSEWNKWQSFRFMLSHFFTEAVARKSLLTFHRAFLSSDWRARADAISAFQPEHREQYGVLAQDIPSFAFQLRREGVHLVLLGLPRLGFEPNLGEKQVRRILLRWTQKHSSFHFIDLSTLPRRVKGLSDESIYYGDFHPNHRVHNIIAQSLPLNICQFKEVR